MTALRPAIAAARAKRKEPEVSPGLDQARRPGASGSCRLLGKPRLGTTLARQTTTPKPWEKPGAAAWSVFVDHPRYNAKAKKKP